MLNFPQIDPALLNLGPIKIHWYGLMYILSFGLAWYLSRYRAKIQPSSITMQCVDDLIFYGALGVILGGRIGYMLFYDFSTLLTEPLTLFKVWQGGMSFHGGLLGVIIALGCYAKSKHLPFRQVTDFIAPVVPLGLAFGRLGNFINGELWGRATTVPWGMVFPRADALPRHPSQLYEFFLEGIILFVLLWWYARKPRPLGTVSGLFLIGYGCMRFCVEFFREPDAQLGFVLFGGTTMGQLLSVPMVLGGLLLFVLAKKKPLASPIVDKAQASN